MAPVLLGHQCASSLLAKFVAPTGTIDWRVQFLTMLQGIHVVAIFGPTYNVLGALTPMHYCRRMKHDYDHNVGTSCATIRPLDPMRHLPPSPSGWRCFAFRPRLLRSSGVRIERHVRCHSRALTLVRRVTILRRRGGAAARGIDRGETGRHDDFHRADAKRQVTHAQPPCQRSRFRFPGRRGLPRPRSLAASPPLLGRSCGDCAAVPVAGREAEKVTPLARARPSRSPSNLGRDFVYLR